MWFSGEKNKGYYTDIMELVGAPANGWLAAKEKQDL